MKKVENFKQEKAYDEDDYKYTCGYAVEDIIDFFIDHDNCLFYKFKKNVHFIDQTRGIDTTLTKEEISDYFINLKETLKQEGYKCESGPFIDEKDLNPRCRFGVTINLKKKGTNSKMYFGVDSTENKVIDTIIRYKTTNANQNKKVIKPIKEKEIELFCTVTTPDGKLIRLPIYEGQRINDRIHEFEDNWFELTSKDPEEFGHQISKDRCPKCGGEVHCSGNYHWCIDCRYMFREQNTKD